MAELVTCHSGSEYAEYPLAFQFQGRDLPVDEILARWRTPAGKCFRVRAAGALYDLIYDEGHDQWRVEPLFSTSPSSDHHQEPA
jgi:hypothetical protein